MRFCPDCHKVLILKTDTGYPIQYCSMCIKNFDGDNEDTMIDSSFSDTQGYNTDTILKYAPFDPVNERIKYDCPSKGCTRKYMTKVFLDNIVWYVCDNCPIRLQGKDVNVPIE